MPIRPPLELRADLIDTIIALGISFYEATRIADSVISSSGQIQSISQVSAREVISQVNRITSMSSYNQALQEATQSLLESNGVWVASRGSWSSGKKTTGKPVMWEGGPPQPGWLVPKMTLTKRNSGLLYVVSGICDRILLRNMPGNHLESITTEYRNLHKEWKATQYILCDDCRYNGLSKTICEDCSKRRARRTGCDTWELPKFCAESFDDRLPLPPTRFEREPVI